MLEHVADDEGQVVLSYNLLAVAKFGDTLGNTLCLLGSEFQSQFLQIAGDVSLAAVLAKCILTLTSESLRHKVVAIEVILVVAIGMHSSHLCEHIITDDWLIGRNCNTRISFHESANVVEFVLMDTGLGIKLVLENHLNARQRGIATSLPQPIHRDMQSLGTTEHGGKRVAHREVVVVVGMEVEVQIGIALHHLAEILNHLQGIHDAKSVGQHEALHLGGAQGVHHLIDILGRVLHAIAPVLEIEINGDAP